MIATEWRSAGIQVLCDVDPRHHEDPQGSCIVIACADGHQYHDILAFEKGFTPNGTEPMVHSLCLNGGPLLLAPGTPLLNVGDTDDVVLMKHLAQASRIKEVRTLIEYGHVPCGAARVRNLSIVEIVKAVFAARERLKSYFRDLQIIPKLHVDWSMPGEATVRRTYFLNQVCFDRWLAGLNLK
jgi:hypothetical protein